jgi:hypothetical protein
MANATRVQAHGTAKVSPRAQLAAAMKSKKRGRFPVAPKAERTINGIVFASKREARRYAVLKQQEKAGIITHLELQPAFKVTINGHLYCTYKADFAYFRDGERIIEDCKSSGTAKDAAYRLRKRAAELQFFIQVREVGV